MFYHIDPASGIPIYVQLIGQIKNCIAGGILVPGDKLPSVRELAAQLTVNPNTIQKAYQELELNGIIETQRGKGTFVCGIIPAEFGQEREQKLEAMVRTLFVEAYHLNFTKEEFLRIFEKEMENWDSFKGGIKDE